LRRTRRHRPHRLPRPHRRRPRAHALPRQCPHGRTQQLAKFGDKSQAFDVKCADCEQQRPDLVPDYVSVPETTKDRALIAQVRTGGAAVAQLADDLFCTELVLGGDIADSDKALYGAIRLAAESGVPGAQAIYEDLK